MISTLLWISAVSVLPAQGTPFQRDTGNTTGVYDFSEFACALLEVPLDYEDEEAGTTAMALIKKVGQGPDAKDIIVNSGGPGGSGVQMALSAFADVEAKVGTKENLIGLDPRGVNNSGPSLDCFVGPLGMVQERLFLEDTLVPVDGQDEFELAQSFERNGIYGKACSAMFTVNGTARYANTPAVAQDILHYIQLSAQCKGEDPKEAKLYYYGISYGTNLGTTFASLYPDRIGRMILDGVGDLEDYYNHGWTTALVDNDATARELFKSCFEAGPELCLFHGGSSSWEEIEQRYLAMYAQLREAPIVATLPENGQPVTVTWQKLSQIFFGTTYWPLDPNKGYVMIAALFAEMETGNMTSISAILAEGELENLNPSEPYDSRKVRTATPCIDLNGRYNLSTIEKYREHVEFQVNTSFYGGPSMNAIVGATCRKLEVFPPESQQFDGTPKVEATSHPILFVSNTLDPVTPLRSAKKMAGFFPGSRVLVAEGVGHSSFFTPQSCTNEYMLAYMADGTLPPEDTVCNDRVNPFELAVAMLENEVETS